MMANIFISSSVLSPYGLFFKNHYNRYNFHFGNCLIISYNTVTPPIPESKIPIFSTSIHDFLLSFLCLSARQF